MFSFKNFLLELFDNPWKLIKDDSQTLKLKRQSVQFGLSNPQVYIAENGDKIVTYVKDGYYEVHHVSDGESGSILKDKTNANPRFYSTMIQLYKTQLDRGHRVKIVAPVLLMKHYEKIIKKLTAGTDAFDVQYMDHDTDPTKKVITIRTRDKLIEDLNDFLESDE